MTVKEFIELLKEYPEDGKVRIRGGEGIDGDWAELIVSAEGFSEVIFCEEDN
jgi:hypothetical protein